MLMQIGAVTLDTRPFSADAVDRVASADFAEHALIGSLKGREFMGEGDEIVTVSGQILPGKIGGLTELETLHGLRRAGQAVPLMRGDGRMLGWFVITQVRENHEDLERDGVGFKVQHSITLAKSSPAQASSSLVPSLLSLFGLGSV